MKRLRPSLGQALFLSLALMSLLTAGLVGLTHRRLRQVLEAEVGVRLAHTARLLAAGVDGALVAQFRAGDEELPAYRLMQTRLGRQADLAGVERVYVVSPGLVTLLDSRPDHPPGSYRHALLANRQEIATTERGEAAVSRLYAGEDGRWRLSAFAPVRDAGGRTRALLAIDAPSDFFSPLAELRRRMWVLGSLGLLVAALTALALLRQVQGRLRRLRETVGRARRGDLSAAVGVAGLDEIGALGRELDGMIGRMAAMQDYLESVLGNLGAGLLVLDREGRLALANPCALELLGLQAGDVGRVFGEAVVGEPRLQAFVRDALASGESPSAAEVPLGGGLAKGGRVVAAAASPLRGREGGLALSLTDVTVVKQAERRARVNERLATLGGMAGGLLHELRNPLGSMMVYLDLLRAEAQTPEGGEVLDRTIEQAERLSAFLEDFQVFAGLKPLRNATVDLRDLAEQAAAALTWPPPVRFSGVAGREVRIEGDRRLLEHAVRNLLRNSIEALAGRAGRVSVSVEQHEAEAVIAVSDDGPGIPRERMDEVFDPLFTTKPGGSGLGLTIVERVAEAHGGAVRIGGGEGATRFEIRLPGRTGEGPWPAS